MDINNKIIILCILGGVLLLASFYGSRDETTPSGMNISYLFSSYSTALNISKNSTANLSDNTTTSISRESSVTLKYFWSAYCVYCIREEPILQEVLREHPTLNFIRIDVNKEESIPEMRKYKVSGTPTHVLIDRDSTIISAGLMNKRQLTSFICSKLKDYSCS